MDSGFILDWYRVVLTPLRSAGQVGRELSLFPVISLYFFLMDIYRKKENSRPTCPVLKQRQPL